MVTLTRLLGAFVRWATASPRRALSTLAVPVIAAVLLFGPHPTGPPGLDRPAPAGSTAAIGESGRDGLPTPTTVTVGPSDRPRGVPELPAGPAAVATGYVRTVDSHDARPGHDRDFTDSYRRARRYVTPQVYAQITAPGPRGDYQWRTWVAERARVTVRIDRVAVPDGAPLPTPTTAYVRVRFTQTVTPTAGGTKPTAIPGEITLVTRRQADGRWLITRLLAA